MRVIQLNSSRHYKVKSRDKLLRITFFLYIFGLILASFYYYYSETQNYQINNTPTKKNIVSSLVSKEPRIFSGEEMKNLYNNFRYANTNNIIAPPLITGNTVADKKIRTLAEARGYRLRRLARDTLSDVDGHPIQILAVKPWQDLKAAATRDGIVLTITWAFRSIEDQRAIFLAGLEGAGISTQDIADGRVDDSVDRVLQTYAPPGYSRHHTGFTIDLTCGTNGLTNFAETPCFEWISKDNYLHAKTFGWIPSYPAGANLQGPEPEPWEYVWVTSDALLK
jgi:hypothetical protein